ncbi:MAG: DNA adenine methylase [Candidatus Acidiferrales bacterium]
MLGTPYLLQVTERWLTIREPSSRKSTVFQGSLNGLRKVRPILKWPGGKQWLARAAKMLAPRTWEGTYYEPFLGGGAVFFSLCPRRAILSDSNEELINAYRTLRNDTEGLIRLLSTYHYDDDFFYRLRDRNPASRRAVAARMIYLNRTCWNGLYRINPQGRFNTPFGKYENPTICDRVRLRAAARTLRPARLVVGDFASVVSSAAGGDFVYFDPPYTTGHTNNGFVKYNARLFSWNDQKRLARVARTLALRGVHVLVSNADHREVAKLFRGFHAYRVQRPTLIGGQTDSRGKVYEALFSSYLVQGAGSEVY